MGSKIIRTIEHTLICDVIVRSRRTCQNTFEPCVSCSFLVETQQLRFPPFSREFYFQLSTFLPTSPHPVKVALDRLQLITLLNRSRFSVRTFCIMIYKVLTVLAACTAVTNANELASRQSCSPDFRICAPAAATSNSLGPIGSSWTDLYMSIVNVVGDYAIGADAPTTTTVDPNGPARREQAFCCESNSIRSDVAESSRLECC